MIKTMDFGMNGKAQNMMFRLAEQMSERAGITEQLKAENQLEWVQISFRGEMSK